MNISPSRQLPRQTRTGGLENRPSSSFHQNLRNWRLRERFAYDQRVPRLGVGTQLFTAPEVRYEHGR
jgi:hypothetical protein